jgi:gamma-glutamylcyclotransferase (GGCT)/AIG2-like uncharacterized protein YtfP
MLFIDRVFVYGTLRTDGPYYKIFKEYVLSVKKVYTYGTLYIYREYFPAFSSEGNNKIFGEMMTLINTKAVFNILDTMETFYTRKLIDVYLIENDKKFKSWVYHVDPSLGEMQKIDSNIWDNSIFDK